MAVDDCSLHCQSIDRGSSRRAFSLVTVEWSRNCGGVAWRWHIDNSKLCSIAVGAVWLLVWAYCFLVGTAVIAPFDVGLLSFGAFRLSTKDCGTNGGTFFRLDWLIEQQPEQLAQQTQRAGNVSREEYHFGTF